MSVTTLIGAGAIVAKAYQAIQFIDSNKSMERRKARRIVARSADSIILNLVKRLIIANITWHSKLERELDMRLYNINCIRLESKQGGKALDKKLTLELLKDCSVDTIAKHIKALKAEYDKIQFREIEPRTIHKLITQIITEYAELVEANRFKGLIVMNSFKKAEQSFLKKLS